MLIIKQYLLTRKIQKKIKRIKTQLHQEQNKTLKNWFMLSNTLKKLV